MLNPVEFPADLTDRWAEALASGTLEPLTTRVERVDDEGAPFVLRVVSSLEKKAANRRVLDPFMSPYDPGLLVGEVSDTHVCLLNRYPVFERHCLLVTRRAALQKELLDRDDFAALNPLLFELDGLAFYNSGPVAGASQAHKHLQLVATPLDGGPDRVPLEKQIVSQKLPYLRAVGPMPRSADDALGAYHRLRAQLGLRTDGPYNLLATRDWMMMVPRRSESFQGVSLNALAFAGSLLTKNEADLARLKAAGPMRALAEVSGTGLDLG
jgi:ATP adenylyltransferase